MNDKILLLIDGDNIGTQYVSSVYEKANAFGEIYKAHSFANFLKADKRWEDVASKYGIQLNNVKPVSGQLNIADREMTKVATQDLRYLDEIGKVIVVANDKGFSMLAATIKGFGKEAILFHTEMKTRAHEGFDKAFRIASYKSSKMQAANPA